MATVVLGLIFVWSLFVTLRWGLARAFAYAYLPAMLFFFQTPPISLPGIPNLSAATAVGYAVSLALLVRWRDLSVIKFNLIDGLMLVMMIPPAISVAINSNQDGLWDSISQTGELFFRWVQPYFLARVAIQDATARMHTLKVLCVCVVLIGVLAAYEARLSPYRVSRELESRGLAKIANNQVLWRYGLARALVTMGQPIDLGVAGVLTGTMILVLTPAAGRRWNQPLPLAGICCAGGMVLFSVSFTAWVAMAAAFGLYFLLSRPRLGTYLALPLMLALMGGMVYLTDNLLNTEIPVDRPSDDAEASKWIRVRIVQDSWPIATQQAGWFGLGKNVPVDQIGVGSVDNAYLLFVMQTGWLYLTLWAVLMITIAAKAGKAFSRSAEVRSMRLPLAAAMAGCMGAFFAMYTVYYGFVYGLLMCVVFGMISSMTQMYAAYASPALPGPARNGPAHGGPAHGGPAHGGPGQATPPMSYGAPSGSMR